MGGGSEPHREPGLWLRFGALPLFSVEPEGQPHLCSVHVRLSGQQQRPHVGCFGGRARISLILTCGGGWTLNFPGLSHKKTGLQRAEQVGFCAVFFSATWY